MNIASGKLRGAKPCPEPWPYGYYVASGLKC